VTTLHDLVLDVCAWSLENTPHDPWPPRAPLRDDRLDTSCGHGGATVTEAVVKTGDVLSIGAEVRYAQMLGVGPEILGSWDGGYATCRLRGTPNSSWLLSARELLETRVWCHAAPTVDHTWREDLLARLGVVAPNWIVDEETRLIHGDPTLGNTIVQDGMAYLIDPKPPGRGIPSVASVDRGKFLQSMLGWERLKSGHWWPEQISPLADLEDLDLARAVWWCGVHLARIVQRESGDTPAARWALVRAEKLEELTRCATS